MLKAPTRAGAAARPETFAQAAVLGKDGFEVAAVPSRTARAFLARPDARFPRHWMPLEVVSATWNAMAAVKLNVFHWHLPRTKGFRVESRRFPKLHQESSDGRSTPRTKSAAWWPTRATAASGGAEFDIPRPHHRLAGGVSELGTVPDRTRIGRPLGNLSRRAGSEPRETYAFLDDSSRR